MNSTTNEPEWYDSVNALWVQFSEHQAIPATYLVVGGGGGGGTIYYGGGGGACWNNTTAAGSGGSGVVILKYPSTRSLTIAAGLTSSTTTSGSFKITTFTAGTGAVTIA